MRNIITRTKKNSTQTMHVVKVYGPALLHSVPHKDKL